MSFERYAFSTQIDAGKRKSKLSIMKIKKGDTVKMLSGKDRGKTGKVLHVKPKEETVSVEGLNIRTKNVKPRRQGDKGQRIQFPAYVAASKVMLVCPSCGRSTRIGGVREGEKKMRQCKKCKATFQ